MNRFFSSSLYDDPFFSGSPVLPEAASLRPGRAEMPFSKVISGYGAQR